jgi:glycosyltransferase involved in cell wall biosynthesis
MKYHQQPHNVAPSCETARVVLAIKNFAKIKGVCHIGLGVTAENTLQVLRRAHIHCEAWATESYAELRAKLSSETKKQDYTPISHVVVSSPAWITPAQFHDLCTLYPEVEFVMLSHSGTSYLSIDFHGIQNIRGDIDNVLSHHNMIVACNNPRSVKAFDGMFGGKTVYLPNLYDTAAFMPFTHPKPIGHVLRIFNPGASRPWKNQLTAAEAAVMLARSLGVNLEYYVNSKRPDGGERMIESRGELFANLPGCTISDVPWMPWPKFRSFCGTMNLMIEPSFDETFNVCVADSYAAGTPVVTSPSIEWSPRSAWCEPCDPQSIVDVALNLLHNPRAVQDGRDALTAYAKAGTKRWLDFLLKAPK